MSSLDFGVVYSNFCGVSEEIIGCFSAFIGFS